MRTARTFRDDEAVLYDLETESAADLRMVGGRVYAADTSTRITMMVVFARGVNYLWVNSDWVADRSPLRLQIKPEQIRPDGLEGEIVVYWGPDFPFQDLATPEKVWVAHNAMGFDAHVWEALRLPPVRHADSAYYARASGLPGSLDGVGKSLGCGGKEEVGRGVLKKYFRPHGPGVRVPARFAVDILSMARYALQDLHILKCLFEETAGDDSEDALIAAHEEVNARGVEFDLNLCRKMGEVAAQSVSRDGAEIAELTGGRLTSTDLRSGPKMRAWLKSCGVVLPNLQAATVDRFLDTPEDFADDEAGEESPQIDPIVFPVLRLRRSATRITGAKLLRARERSGQSTRLYDLLVYHGAHTGRWTSNGFQVHNMPRGIIHPEEFLPAFEGDPTGAYDRVLALVRKHQAAGRLLTVDDVLSAMVRPLLRAAAGASLLISDYAQVECRGLGWVAGETSLLDIFAQRRDLYKEMATTIFGVPLHAITDSQRQTGKVVVLGCGYGLGEAKLGHYAANFGLNLASVGVTPRHCVEAFRNMFPAIAGTPCGGRDGITFRRGGVWKAYHAAVHETLETGDRKEAGRCVFQKIGRDLVCQLPSGRELVYRRARLEDQIPLWGGEPRPTVIYDGPRGRSYLYGGRIAENVVQAVCRDILAAALVRIEAAGLRPVLHVHDEIVCEHDPARLGEMLAIMSTPPDWAPDFPLECEGYTSDRYMKLSKSCKGEARSFLRGVQV